VKLKLREPNKKRILVYPKIESTLRSLNFFFKYPILFCKIKYPSLEIKLIIIDDITDKNNFEKIKKLINKNDFESNFVQVEHEKYRKIIKKQKSEETYSNLASLLCFYEVAKKNGDELIFFVEDDYLHFEPMIEEMVSSYERISSQLNKDIFICPADYPYLYMNNQKTNILIGNKRHWRTR
jgi:hypothetical protein